MSIPTSHGSGFALSPDLLREVMELDLAPGRHDRVLSNSTMAADPINQLADMANDNNTWVHMDAMVGVPVVVPSLGTT
ncbi:hypothetical protein ACFXTH_024046 [Malus domestica]